MVSGLGLMPTRMRAPLQAEYGGGLLSDGGHAGAVEGEVQASPARSRADVVGEVVGGGVQGEVRTEGQGTLAGAGQRVDGDDRRGAGHAGDADVVGADSADAPDADGLCGAHPGGGNDGGVGGGNRVGDDRCLIEGEVVGDGDERVLAGDGVLGPAAVVVDAGGEHLGSRGGGVRSRRTGRRSCRPQG